MSARTLFGAGKCSRCGGYYRPRRDGTLRKHERRIVSPDAIRYEPCPGSGTEPDHILTPRSEETR